MLILILLQLKTAFPRSWALRAESPPRPLPRDENRISVLLRLAVPLTTRRLPPRKRLGVPPLRATKKCLDMQTTRPSSDYKRAKDIKGTITSRRLGDRRASITRWGMRRIPPHFWRLTDDASPGLLLHFVQLCKDTTLRSRCHYPIRILHVLGRNGVSRRHGPGPRPAGIHLRPTPAAEEAHFDVVFGRSTGN